MRQHLVERELTSEGPLRRAPAQGRRRVTVNLAESPLSWLFARGHLSERQFAAGEQFAAAQLCFEVAHQGCAISPFALGLQLLDRQTLLIPRAGQAVGHLQLQGPGRAGRR